MYNPQPTNYNTWSTVAIDKIEKTINSCETEIQLECVKTMIDHFVMTIAIRPENFDTEIVQEISNHLWLRVQIKALSMEEL